MTIRGKIAAVSYLNTVPFIYGIEHAPSLQHAALVLSPPNKCVTNYANGVADIALVPVEAIPALTDARVVSSYCIGTLGDVRTVVMMTDEPLDRIRTIYTDSHSVTSARLVAILCRELWNIEPRFEILNDYSLIEWRGPGDAFLLIGDKVFDHEGRFAYTHDLSNAWRELTSLPFVFAAWIARSNVPDEHIAMLNDALEYGVTHIPQAIQAMCDEKMSLHAERYLTHNIDYLFDYQKQKALSMFWDKSMKYSPRVNPG